VTRPPTVGTAVPLEQHPLAALLDALEAPAPSPCGGSAAALGGAMGAALVALVCRASTDWAEAPGIAAQATTLRARLVELADEDVRAFAAALEALDAAGEAGGSRDRLLGLALERAADVPLAIAGAASDVAELAALAAAEGKPGLQPDAAVGATLAEAAAAAAARLVHVNLATLPDDERVLRASAYADAARAARDRVLGAPP
jgi:glutamate formiminotransferase/formiminotetrahydrofolate cyclodeaminase